MTAFSRKMMALLLALAAAAVLCACGGQPEAEAANPITEYATPAEAHKAIGLKTMLPEYVPGGYQLQSSITIAGEIVQVAYQNEEGNEISLRAAKDSDEDITGDYTAYRYEDTLEAQLIGSYVTVKGDSMDEIYQGAWKIGNTQYALMLEVGVPEEEVVDIANSLVEPE